jgi:hypothetical protein
VTFKTYRIDQEKGQTAKIFAIKFDNIAVVVRERAERRSECAENNVSLRGKPNLRIQDFDRDLGGIDISRKPR